MTLLSSKLYLCTLYNQQRNRFSQPSLGFGQKLAIFTTFFQKLIHPIYFIGECQIIRYLNKMQQQSLAINYHWIYTLLSSMLFMVSSVFSIFAFVYCEFFWSFCVINCRINSKSLSGKSGVTEGLVFFPLSTNSINFVFFFRLGSRGNQLLRYLGQMPHRCSTPYEVCMRIYSISLNKIVFEVARGKQYFLIKIASLKTFIWLSLQRGSTDIDFIGNWPSLIIINTKSIIKMKINIQLSLMSYFPQSVSLGSLFIESLVLIKLISISSLLQIIIQAYLRISPTFYILFKTILIYHIQLMQADLITMGVLAYEKVISKIKPQTSTAMKSAMVALYSADPTGKLRYSNLIGILQLDIDRQLKSKFLRIYDVETLSLSFEVEIYYGFQKYYRPITDTIYMFEYPKGSIAFQFRNPTQAEIMKSKIVSVCPSLEQYEQVKRKNIEAARKKEEENSFFGRVKNFFSGEKPEQQHQSQVIDVKKNTSVTFDLQNGTFNTENFPPEWQEIFNQLQLSKDDLNNKDVMGVIVEETILNQAKRQAQQQSNKQLQRKVQMAQNQSKKEHLEYQQDLKRNTTLNLPPPPPPPPPLLTPPNMRVSLANNRSNLMDEIRNNNLKLKHVEVNSKEGKAQVTLDISDMNKQERSDHIENLRKKLQMRKKALNRREDDDD